VSGNKRTVGINPTINTLFILRLFAFDVTHVVCPERTVTLQALVPNMWILLLELLKLRVVVLVEEFPSVLVLSTCAVSVAELEIPG
jgi:hypothetical protein